jgi:aarF domain-containing kinase
MLRRVGLGIGGLGVAGAVAASQDEGIQRSNKFWAHAMPIFLHYKFVEYQTAFLKTPTAERDAKFNDLHERYAPVAEALTLEMKGFYLKNAQFMSTLSDDFLPTQYMDWMSKTQDQVPTPFAPGEARAIVERSIGKKIEDVFSSWEEEPMGAASIGQVHRAVLKENGRKVVVKVQYPGIEAMFRNDLGTTINFCKLAMKQHVRPMEEIEKQFVTEFDYVGEAKNMEEIAGNMERGGWSDRIVVPRPVTELCTKEVLVMDELEAPSLVKGLKANYREMARLQGTTLEAMEEKMKEEVRNGSRGLKDAGADAEEMVRVGRMIHSMDVVKNIPRWMWNWSVGLVTGRVEYEWTTKPINLGAILQTLSEVHAYQIFVDGVYNGDPHPGNILLFPDGRLGLIDYGQVKRWTLDQRLAYAELIVALAEDDRAEIVRAFHEELHMNTQRNDPAVHYRLACFWNDRNTDDVTEGLNLQEFQDWAEGTDPQVSIPNWPIMASRVNVLIRGMGNAFGLHLTVAGTWSKYAREILDEHGPAGGRAIDVD